MHPSGLMSPHHPARLADYNGFIPNDAMASTVPDKLNDNQSSRDKKNRNSEFMKNSEAKAGGKNAL